MTLFDDMQHLAAMKAISTASLAKSLVSSNQWHDTAMHCHKENEQCSICLNLTLSKLTD